jgi:NADH:ubiquinone oxidoreductase subunit H
VHSAIQQADQIFVIGQHRLVSYIPVEFQSIADVIISVIAIVLVFALLFAVTTVLERKGLGRIQNRYGPNRVGPAGFFQPLADGVKSLTKEDLVRPQHGPGEFECGHPVLFCRRHIGGAGGLHGRMVQSQ